MSGDKPEDKFYDNTIAMIGCFRDIYVRLYKAKLTTIPDGVFGLAIGYIEACNHQTMIKVFIDRSAQYWQDLGTNTELFIKESFPKYIRVIFADLPENVIGSMASVFEKKLLHPDEIEELTTFIMAQIKVSIRYVHYQMGPIWKDLNNGKGIQKVYTRSYKVEDIMINPKSLAKIFRLKTPLEWPSAPV